MAMKMRKSGAAKRIPHINLRANRALALAVAGIGALCNRSTNAANDAWSTGPGGNTFTGTNWTTGQSTPGAANGTIGSTDSLFFGNSTTTSLNQNETAGFTIGSITFNAGTSSAYVIGDGTANANAGNSFTLTGGISNLSGTAQIINAPITLSGNQSFSLSTAAGTLTLGGNVTGAAVSLTTNGGTGGGKSLQTLYLPGMFPSPLWWLRETATMAQRSRTTRQPRSMAGT